MRRGWPWSWVQAWVTLADGLASTLTFGLWWPNWSFKFVVWDTLQGLPADESTTRDGGSDG